MFADVLNLFNIIQTRKAVWKFGIYSEVCHTPGVVQGGAHSFVDLFAIYGLQQPRSGPSQKPGQRAVLDLSPEGCLSVDLRPSSLPGT